MDLAQAALGRAGAPARTDEATNPEGLSVAASEVDAVTSHEQEADRLTSSKRPPSMGASGSQRASVRPPIVPPPGMSGLGEAAVQILNETLRRGALAPETVQRFSNQVLDNKSPLELVLSVHVSRALLLRTIFGTSQRQQLVRNITIALGRTGQPSPSTSRPHTDLLGFPQRDLVAVDVAYRLSQGQGSVLELQNAIKNIESAEGLRAAFEAVCRLVDMDRIDRKSLGATFGGLYRCQSKLVGKLGSNASVIPLAAAGLRAGHSFGSPTRPIELSRQDLDLLMGAILRTPVELVGNGKAFILALTRSQMFATEDLMLLLQSLEERASGSAARDRRGPSLMD